MKRRMFLGRFLGGLGVAAAATGTANALVKSPESGLKVLPSRLHEKDVPGQQLSPGGYEHIQMPLEWWQKPVEWLGDPLDHNWPLSWWLSGFERIQHSEAEFQEAFKFYVGVQWPEDIMEARMKDGRPSLTINMIHRVVERAIRVSRERGEDTALKMWQWQRVFINAYRRNRDAQLHYNALQSARLEMFNVHQPERFMMEKAFFDKEDPIRGHLQYKTEGMRNEPTRHIPPTEGVRAYFSDESLAGAYWRNVASNPVL